MKRLIFWLFTVFCVPISWAQKNNFNSICIWFDDSCNVFQTVKIDSITHSNIQNCYLQNVWTQGLVKSIDVTSIDSVSVFNLYDSNITIFNTEDGQDWEEVYTTPIGTFAYSSILAYNEKEYADLYEVISYMSEDWTTSACILFDKESHIPVRFNLDSNSIYFSIMGDSIISVIRGDSTCITEIGDYEIDLSAIDNYIEEQGYTSVLKEHIFKLLYCLKKEDVSDISIRKLLDRFETLLDKNESKDTGSEQTKQILINVYNKGEEPKKKSKGNILYSAVVATNGYNGLTDTSCSPSGSVYIAYSHYNEDCTYGILVDENPDNLYYGKATFSVSGHQETKSRRFSVDVSGLQPSTKYYYRAYLRINPKNYNTSPLVVRYDNGNHEEESYNPIRPTLTYGNVKTFTTNVPDVSGTWTCTEEYYNGGDNQNPQYKSYPIVLQKDGSVIINGKGDYVGASWSYKSNGELIISIIEMGTINYTSGFDVKLTADDSKNPKKFTGYINKWNYSNAVGYRDRGGNAVVLTRYANSLSF